MRRYRETGKDDSDVVATNLLGLRKAAPAKPATFADARSALLPLWRPNGVNSWGLPEARVLQVSQRAKQIGKFAHWDVLGVVEFSAAKFPTSDLQDVLLLPVINHLRRSSFFLAPERHGAN